jgi:hypothetical protein
LIEEEPMRKRPRPPAPPPWAAPPVDDEIDQVIDHAAAEEAPPSAQTQTVGELLAVGAVAALFGMGAYLLNRAGVAVEIDDEERPAPRMPWPPTPPQRRRRVSKPKQRRRVAPPPPPPLPVDADRAAAELLGVSLDADESAIRAALRAKMKAGNVHPDQGGDAERAKRLVMAQNRLIERARKLAGR